MRAGLRKQLVDNVLDLDNVYEPNVPSKDTIKPYAVVVQGEDRTINDPTNFSRNIEVWIYNDIDSFQTLDKLMYEVIEALDLKTFTDPNTLLSYTTKFEGTISQDIVDEEWKAIVRGVRFSVISLHDKNAEGTDSWEKATADFIESTIEGIKTYRGTWKEDFQVPSVLCRTLTKSQEQLNYMAFRENREMRIHVVAESRERINVIMDSVEYDLMRAIKIPLDIKGKRYLTITSIREERDADMLGVGQITVSMTRIKAIERDIGVINKIQGRRREENP